MMLEDFAKYVPSFGKFNDLQEVGIGGFTTEVRVSESIEFTSDVPDNYVEDGSIIHDHVINNPIILTIEGEVADIHIKSEFIGGEFFKPIDKASGIISSLFPSSKTQQMLQKLRKKAVAITDAFNKIEDVFNKGKSLFDFFGSTSDSVQDNFFDFLNKVYYSKELISIEMPFQTYENMRITSLTIIRDNTTSQALKYKITAKEVRFAETILVDADKYFKEPAPSVKGKVAGKKNKGTIEGKKVSKSSTTKGRKKSFLATLLS